MYVVKIAKHCRPSKPDPKQKAKKREQVNKKFNISPPLPSHHQIAKSRKGHRSGHLGCVTSTIFSKRRDKCEDRARGGFGRLLQSLILPALASAHRQRYAAEGMLTSP